MLLLAKYCQYESWSNEKQVKQRSNGHIYRKFFITQIVIVLVQKKQALELLWFTYNTESQMVLCMHEDFFLVDLKFVRKKNPILQCKNATKNQNM